MPIRKSLPCVLLAASAIAACGTSAPSRRAPQVAAGTAVTFPIVGSKYAVSRRVDVWLPPGYREDRSARYPVIYMHDGQNLFDDSLAGYGVEWGIDEAMGTLIAEGRVRPAIIVGVWNTDKRFGEYFPQQALTQGPVAYGIGGRGSVTQAALNADGYLRYLVEELKPAIDSVYRTRRGPEHTFVMGSSMGALISAYALARYPQVFGGAACVSTHWPAGDGAAIPWFAANLPRAGTHRLYFDYGTTELDSLLPPLQARMDTALAALGYVQGRDWMTRRFEGAKHHESAWRARVDVPLTFLLGTAPEGAAP
jgi:predicted alpha/beta superfamily hydrolase